MHVKYNDSNFLAYRSKVMLLLWVVFVICGSCLSVILSCLFLATLWSPAANGSDVLAHLNCDDFLRFCHFHMRFAESDVVFDCIDS